MFVAIVSEGKYWREFTPSVGTEAKVLESKGKLAGPNLIVSPAGLKKLGSSNVKSGITAPGNEPKFGEAISSFLSSGVDPDNCPWNVKTLPVDTDDICTPSAKTSPVANGVVICISMN